MSNPPNIIYPLQYLRGIAACWVMLFHYMGGFIASNPIEEALLFIAKQGFFGVDIFFVISGFISAYSFGNKQRSVGRFMARRVLRIFLGYWPVLLLFWLVLMMSDHDMQPYDFWRSFFLIPQSLLHNPLMIVWTLYHELIFYALFAIALRMPRNIRMLAISMASCGVVATLIYFALNGHYNNEKSWWQLWTHQTHWLPYMITPYLLEFVCGVYLFYMKTATGFYKTAILAIISLVMACSINAALFDNQLHYGYREFYRVVIALPFSALFVLAAIRWKPHKPIHWLSEIGHASFSIYLLHLPLLYTARWMYDDALLIQSSNPIQLSTMCVFTIIFSWIWYRTIERKLYNIIKDKMLLRRKGNLIPSLIGIQR